MNTVMYFVLLALLPPAVISHSMSDAERLFVDKQVGNRKDFRPLVNQSEPLVLYTSMELVFIQDFNEVQEKLSITASLVISWKDEYMKWNPQDYGGMPDLVVDRDKIWAPNLVLVNSVEKLDKVGDDWNIIRFTSDGLALYYPGDVFSASCKVDVTYYPWDSHICEFSFAQWGYRPNEVQLQPIQNKVGISYYSENGAWTFHDSSVDTTYSNESINFYLHLERKPRFVLVNIICPIVFMAFLNVMIFAIPIESGERVSYSITMLLAIAVFLTLVGDNLPKTSNPMSMFSYYLLTVLAISICIVLATIFNVRLYYIDENDQVPWCLASFVKCLKCKCRREKYNRGQTYKKDFRERNRSVRESRFERQKRQIQIPTSDKNYRDNHVFPSFSPKSFPNSINSSRNIMPGRIYDANTINFESDQHSLKHQTIHVEAKVSWKDVSQAFDKLFFILSFLIISIGTFVFFIHIFATG